MKLISCYSPKVIRNKYTGDLVVARCGRCPACLNARSAQWVQRLDQEILQHRYTFFVTLQFDEQHVKQLVLLDKCDRPSDFPAYIDISTSEIIDLDFFDKVTQADIHYCENTKFLLVHDVSLIQNFVKRLRKILYEKFPDERLRYYIALEYGPQTFRPHCHSLFFFDSPLLAKDFQSYLVETWQYGSVFDAHPISGSASQYVASYVNSFANLPKIYLHPRIKQKALFSKCPPIGTFTWSEETFKQFFDSSVTEMPIFRKDVSKFSDVPLWRSVQSRLYPKIVGFDRLSNIDRISLYRLGFRFIENWDCFDFSNGESARKVSEINVMYLANFLDKEYWRCYRRLFVSKSNKCEHSKRVGLNETSLKRFISAVSRVCQNCLSWDVSLEDYVTKIVDFYEELRKKELSDFYHLQDEYFKTHPISDFLTFNPNFCVSVANKLPSELSDWQRFYLSIYAPDLLVSDKPIFIKYNSSSAFQSLKGVHDKIYFDNTKQKKSNDYLLAHKDKFNNIISYNQEIKNYVKSEII